MKIQIKYLYYIDCCRGKFVLNNNPSKCPCCKKATIIKKERYKSMSNNKNQHVTPHKAGGWQVKGSGNSRATIRTPRQSDAIKIARDIAIKNNSEVVIHGQNGRIREKNSYGNDPFPPRG